MNKDDKRGGRRKNSGRKPAKDPKLNLSIYIETSIIEKNGGLTKSKEKVISFLEKEASEINEHSTDNNK